MARGKKHTAEQIVSLLRQVEVGVANGKTLPQAYKEAEIVGQTYYRWRKEYGGLKVDQPRRLKELEQENAKLKRLVSELSLEKLVLKDISSGMYGPLRFCKRRDASDTGRFAQMYPASRESAAFGDQAMMKSAHAVPNNLVRS
jgi:putative transposase